MIGLIKSCGSIFSSASLHMNHQSSQNKNIPLQEQPQCCRRKIMSVWEVVYNGYNTNNTISSREVIVKLVIYFIKTRQHKYKKKGQKLWMLGSTPLMGCISSQGIMCNLLSGGMISVEKESFCKIKGIKRVANKIDSCIILLRCCWIMFRDLMTPMICLWLGFQALLVQKKETFWKAQSKEKHKHAPKTNNLLHYLHY